MEKRFLTFLMILSITLSAAAQIQLGSVYSRAVKDGYNVATAIDTVLVETAVGNGVAKTVMTFVLRPGYSDASRTFTQNSISLDSIEMSLSFFLPTDFVAKNMQLWINGAPQTAYIQDRQLANAQYTQIVGARKDPALLDFWGNGNYNLRIFPTSSNIARKVSIEFEHTFDDDTLNVMRASIPTEYDSLHSYYNQGSSFVKKIGFMKVTLTANDGSIYNYSQSGLGQGSFALNKPLVLSGQNLSYVKSGEISSTDPSGPDVEFAWSGVDKIDNKINLGFTTTLADSTITKEPEPQTRIIALDIRNRIFNYNTYSIEVSKNQGYTYTPYSGYTDIDIFKRAQKYAIMCLQTYLKADQKFNVVIGGSPIKKVFGTPVSPTDENLLIAYKAIAGAQNSSQSRTMEVIKEASLQAGKGVVVLISDLYQPTNSYSVVNNQHTVTNTGLQYNSLLDSISSFVKSTSVTLFTIADEWRLSSLGTETGGFQIGSLRWENNYYNYVLDAATKLYVPVYRGLPALYGSYNNNSLVINSITSPDLNEIVYSTNGGYSYWFRGGLMLDKRASGLNKGTMFYPYWYSNNLELQVAAKTTSAKNKIVVTVNGKSGGLRFTKNISVFSNSTLLPSSNTSDNTQWAFRKSEYLANTDYAGSALAIKQIGKDYHIVTRQTSLLALESWMQLWVDTLGQNQGTSEKRATASFLSGAPNANVVADSATVNGLSIDSISIEDIIAKRSPVIRINQSFKKGAMSLLSVNSNMIRIQLSSGYENSLVTASLYDLRGSCIAEQSFNGNAIKNSVLVLGTKFSHNANGYYSLKIRVGSVTKMFRLSTVSR